MGNTTLFGILFVILFAATDLHAANLPHISFGGDTAAQDDLDGQGTSTAFVSSQPSAFDNGQYKQAGETQSYGNLRNSIPGEPDIDYPIYAQPPDTSFRCKSRADGYYADVEARCQVFRVCANTDLSGKGFAFLCPNGTLFNQEVFVCDWYKNVDCSQSANFYGKNNEMNMNINSVTDMMKVVRDMQMFPLKQIQNLPGPSRTNFNNLPRTVVPPNPSSIGGSKPLVDLGANRPTGNVYVSTETPFPAVNGPNNNGFNPNQLTTTERPQINDDKFTTKTTEFEGDGEFKSRLNNTNQDDVSVDSLSARPIYVSSLGELSTDFGDKFDVSKVNLIKPAENGAFIPPTTDQNAKKTNDTGSRFFINQGQPFGTQISSDFDATPVNSGSADLLGQSLREKQGPNAGGFGVNQINSGSGNLLGQSLGQRQPPKVDQFGMKQIDSGSGDLLGQSLSQRQQPNDSGFGIKQIDSGSGDLLAQSLGQAQGQNNAGAFGVQQINSGSGDLLGQSLNKGQQQNNNGFGVTRINSGSGDLLAQSLAQRQGQINSGSGDLLGQTLGQQQGQNNADSFGVRQVDSGSGDLLGQSLGQTKQPNADGFGVNQINSGSGDLLAQTLGQRQQPNDSGFGVQQINYGSGDLLGQSLAQNQGQNNADAFGVKQIDSGSGDLLGQSLGQRQQPKADKFGLKQINSGSGDLLGQSLAQNLRPGADQFRVDQINSGSGDLLGQTLGQQQGQYNAGSFGVKQVESGSGDLLGQSLGQRKQPNADRFGVNQINSGSGDLLGQSLAQSQKPNANGFGINQINSGSGELLGQSLGQAQHRDNANGFGVNGINSGSGDLPGQTLSQRQQPNTNGFGVKQINSGSGDLLGQSLGQRQPPKVDQFGVKQISSGSGDLLGQSLGQRQQPNGSGFGVKQIDSGSGDLLSQSLGQRQGQNNADAFAVKQINSGSGDLLGQSLGQRQQPNDSGFGVKQIDSGSGGLLDQSLAQNSGSGIDQFRVNQIDSGSGDLLGQSLAQNQGQNNADAFGVKQIDSGSGDLLGQTLNENGELETDHEISISHNNPQIQARPNAIGNAFGGNSNSQYSKEVDFPTRNLNRQSQSGASQLGKQAFANNGNIYTQTTFSHRTKSQSTLENTQRYHYKISKTQTVDANGNVVNHIPGQQITINPFSTTLNRDYIPPQTTPVPVPTPKQIFTYPEIFINANEIANSSLGYRQAIFRNDATNPTLRGHESDEHNLKNRNALNLLFRGFQLNLYENELLDSASTSSDDFIAENVKSKRHDITQAQTYLNKSIISPEIEIYTYFADYPEPNDTMDTTVDSSKLISPDEIISNETNDSTFRIDLSEFDAPSDSAPNNSNENTENEDSEFVDLDFDKTIFDSTFLPSKERQNDNAGMAAPVPLSIPEDSDQKVHRNVKRHKSEPLPYLPPTDSTPAPPLPTKNNISNAISDDLQNNGGHQLDARFGSKDKQQQLLDPLSLRKFSQQISTSKNRAQAYYYTSIENNRPIANYAIPPPPLQTHYPAAIQNNFASNTVRPLQYRSTPIPASLPSIVYSPTAVHHLPNYVQQSVKIPIPPSLAAASNAQYYSAPAIRPCDLPPNHPNEKVVVKIVPATGWYLNDEKERKSYYDAVAQGLLNENGFVYVNDVQRYSSQSTQNVPRVWYSSSAPLQSPPPSPAYSLPSYYRSSQRWELPQYGSPVPVVQPQPTRQPEPRQLSPSSEKPSAAGDNVYRGDTSYSVPLKSVGKLAGDNNNQTYSLASLRTSSGASGSSSTDRIFNRQTVR